MVACRPTSTRAVALVETPRPTAKPSWPPPPTHSASHPTPRSSASRAPPGLTRRAFYGHFANRDELVVAVIDVGAARLNAIAADTDDPHAPTAIALLGARLWGAVEHVRVLAGMAVREPYAAHAAEALAPVRDRLRALVERGVAEGTVRPDIRADVLARLIESAAIAVLLEAAVTGIADAEGRRLVMLAVLGTAGLSWRDSAELIDTAPALAAPTIAAGEPRA
jgi:AcrR family transcriptional regulator